MKLTESIDISNLSEIFKGLECGLIFTDASRNVSLINSQAEKILKIKGKQIYGKPFRSLLPSGFSEGIKTSQSTTINGKAVILYSVPFTLSGEFGGEVFMFNEAGDPLTINDLSIPSDVDHQMVSVLEGFYDGIIIVDNNQITKINSSICRITGLKSEAILNKNVTDLDGETHVCLHTIQEVVSLVQKFKKSITSMGTLSKGNEIYVTGTPVLLKGAIQYIVVNIRDITELQLLKKEVSRLMAMCLSTPEDVRIKQITGGEIIVENHIMRGILDLIARVAQVDTIVMFEGESGTGKELMARLLHRLSARRNGPFISVNCGAIPVNLFETELFGYAKGAFTGASKDGKPGLFELAEKGVIFLDEIGDLPAQCQVKILKVIEDFEIMPVGGVKSVKLDVRIIAATNKNLKKQVEKGDFREDLYYRLNVVPIELPPLRNRREDIFQMAWQFLSNCNEKFNQSKTFSQGIIQVLESYPWPGNVRELQNAIERMVITSEEEVLQPYHLPHNIYNQETHDDSMIQVKGIMTLNEARETLERKLLSHAMSLKKTTREAARLLGVDHSTVVRKLKKYNLNINGEIDSE